MNKDRTKKIYEFLEKNLENLKENIKNSTDIKSQLEGYTEKFKMDLNEFMSSNNFTTTPEEQRVIDDFCEEVLKSLEKESLEEIKKVALKKVDNYLDNFQSSQFKIYALATSDSASLLGAEFMATDSKFFIKGELSPGGQALGNFKCGVDLKGSIVSKELTDNSKLAILLGGEVKIKNDYVGRLNLLGSASLGYFDDEFTILASYLKGVESYQNGIKPTNNPISKLEVSAYYTPEKLLGENLTFKLKPSIPLNGEKHGGLEVGIGLKF